MLDVRAVVDSSELANYNGRFIQVFSYARLGGLHYAHPLDLVVMLVRPLALSPAGQFYHGSLQAANCCCSALDRLVKNVASTLTR